jgi:hypothetical protein
VNASICGSRSSVTLCKRFPIFDGRDSASRTVSSIWVCEGSSRKEGSIVEGLPSAASEYEVFDGAEKEERISSHVRFSVCNLCILSA